MTEEIFKRPGDLPPPQANSAVDLTPLLNAVVELADIAISPGVKILTEISTSALVTANRMELSRTILLLTLGISDLATPNGILRVKTSINSEDKFFPTSNLELTFTVEPGIAGEETVVIKRNESLLQFAQERCRSSGFRLASAALEGGKQFFYLELPLWRGEE
jgi:hypothetical protein